MSKIIKSMLHSTFRCSLSNRNNLLKYEHNKSDYNVPYSLCLSSLIHRNISSSSAHLKRGSRFIKDDDQSGEFYFEIDIFLVLN